ncbi:hypothetical protein GDO81_017730 [Engystomops pustulosus]|uniref:Acyl-CoA-binding domain-containing protein 6 n=1 Tax=Engystomops pustulosus TaxID=76066 RepID=A0AAV7A1L5_ENGPU|nr:hypothetical protein GDO81_017730 [Engystomops pustulosus]
MASPEVVEDSSSGEACSGGYGELGDFLQEERADEEEDEQLRYHFEQAAQHAQQLAHVASTQQLLYLYARYKQVKVGKCTTSKPGFFDFEGRQKWEAWKSLGDYSSHQAMRDYIETVRKLDPDWKPKEPEEPVEKHKSTFGGPVVSCLYQEQETLRDEDKDIFDYCRENDILRISQALALGTIDVNAADDEDAEGQTPLHYASACEFSDIVEMLLEHGADPTLVDHDGFQPHEATDNKEISEMLKEHVSFGEHDKSPSLLQSAN